jgi:hypothetical protein
VIDTGSIILDQTEVLIVTEIIYGIHNFTNEASNISPNILSLSYVTSNKHRCSTRKIQPYIWTILLLSGDIEINLGPSKCPCGICKPTVASNHRAIQCDDCDDWIHIRCGNITPTEYNRLQSISHFTWTCPPYGSINLSTTSINDIDISNPYSSLTEELSNDENDNVFEPTINTTSSEFDEEPPKLQKHTRALN